MAQDALQDDSKNLTPFLTSAVLPRKELTKIEMFMEEIAEERKGDPSV
jgi:hypothetical protein